ncbi:MAG TPA: response regulator [Anaerolineales bacterium]|nr:response regulator [Anaerolineales bacterium]
MLRQHTWPTEKECSETNMPKQRVLIADDEKLLRSLMTNILCHDGFETVAVEDGLQALQVLEDSPDFSLVISDIQMPRMDGMSLLQNMRQFYPNIPVLITSVHTSISTMEAILQQGAVYLPRPFTARQLIDAAHQAINSSP